MTAADLHTAERRVPYFAHRFGRAYGPDSSRPALAAALHGSVEGLETDCTLTADDQIVLLHDPLLHRGTTLTGWAHHHRAQAITTEFLRDRDGNVSDEHPLLLDDLWPLVDGEELTVQLEIKAICDDDLAQQTCRVLCEHLESTPPPRGVQIEIISFWPDVLPIAAAAGWDTRLIVAAPHQPAALKQWAVDHGITGLILEAEFWSAGHVDEWRSAGLSLMSGVCNDPILAALVLAFEPDAIATDRPNELRQELASTLPPGENEPVAAIPGQEMAATKTWSRRTV